MSDETKGALWLFGIFVAAVVLIVFAATADRHSTEERCRAILSATTDTLAVLSADPSCISVVRRAER